MARKSEFSEPISMLEVGQTVSFPIEKMQSIRVVASNLGGMLQRSFATSRNQSDKTLYDVTRLS